MSTAQYRRFKHPTCHFHIGSHTQNRWPIARALTPYMFCLMIIQLYYPDYWNLNDDNRDHGDGYVNEFDRMMASEKAKCTPISGNFFHRLERSHLYFE
jgi:hypothetical protein